MNPSKLSYKKISRFPLNLSFQYIASHGIFLCQHMLLPILNLHGFGSFVRIIVGDKNFIVTAYNLLVVIVFMPYTNEIHYDFTFFFILEHKNHVTLCSLHFCLD